MYTRIVVSIFLFIFLYTAGCSDNPVDPGDDEHAEVDGAALVRDDQEIFRVVETVVSGNPGYIALTIGETASITVMWLDHDGDEVHEEELEEEGLFLDVAVADPQTATVELVPGEPWDFRITGLSAGSTTIEVFLMHNPDDPHPDFRTGPIGVEVASDSQP